MCVQTVSKVPHALRFGDIYQPLGCPNFLPGISVFPRIGGRDAQTLSLYLLAHMGMKERCDWKRRSSARKGTSSQGNQAASQRGSSVGNAEENRGATWRLPSIAAPSRRAAELSPQRQRAGLGGLLVKTTFSQVSGLGSNLHSATHES